MTPNGDARSMVKRFRCARFTWLALVGLALGMAGAGCASGPGKPPSPPEQPVFYPLPPDPPRMQYLTAINGAWDVTPPRSGLAALILGEEQRKPSETVVRPYGIAVWNGKIYVCDMTANNVKVFDLEQKRFYVLGRGIIVAPTTVCIDSEGYKFVVESWRKLIQVFDPADKHLTTFRLKEGRPTCVAAVGNQLFVTDIPGNRIVVLDRSTGKQLRTFGKKGSGPGEFLKPIAITRDSKGFLYVSDQWNYRFQKLDTGGKPLMSVGKPGDSYGHFQRPRGIAVSPDGVIYVVEVVFEVVQMFNQKGQVLMGFGNFHGAPGFLEGPAGIAVDKSCLPYFADYVDPRFEPEYLVFVVSTMGAARIGVYAFGHLKPGAEIPPVHVPKAKERPAATQPKPSATSQPKPKI